MGYPVVLAVDHHGFGVPYWRPEDDPLSHSYVDLKKNPEQISLIPEAQDWPELKAAIEKISSPDSIYTTLGCAAWVYPASDGSERMKLVSYIDFWHDRLDLNHDLGVYYNMFHGFSTFLSKKTLPEQLLMYFVVRPTGLNGGKEGTGWSAELGVNGYGSSIEEARTTPNLAFSLLTEFLFPEPQPAP